MMKVIAIIGDHNAGKSTLIRHITGVSKPKTVQLERSINELVNVYVRTQAPQEPPVKILPLELVEILSKQTDSAYAILPFRIEGVRNKIEPSRNAPGFAEYLDTIRLAGHEIIEPVILIKSDDITIESKYQWAPFERETSNILANKVKLVVNFK